MSQVSMSELTFYKFPYILLVIVFFLIVLSSTEILSLCPIRFTFRRPQRPFRDKELEVI